MCIRTHIYLQYVSFITTKGDPEPRRNKKKHVLLFPLRDQMYDSDSGVQIYIYFFGGSDRENNSNHVFNICCSGLLYLFFGIPGYKNDSLYTVICW